MGKFSPTAKPDLTFASNGIFFTAELKMRSDSTVTVQWLASGLDVEKSLRAFLTLRISCAAMNEKDALDQVERMLPSVTQLASIARASQGLMSATREGSDVQDFEIIVATHLRYHLTELSSAGSAQGAAERTALEAAFCKSVGLTKFIDFLARFEGVPITTIRRRMDNARTLGLVPKRGAGVD